MRTCAISIHAPRTGSDPFRVLDQPRERAISIHAPRTGSDLAGKRGEETSILFQSTLPARGATTVRGAIDEVYEFQSTLPARGATASSAIFRRSQWISIHAPRTGSDEAVLEGLLFTCQFQSTLPARGATRTATHKRRRERFQSTLPARGATAVAAPAALHGAISIHAPRTGSDGIFSRRSSSTESFQSTLPARGATP